MQNLKNPSSVSAVMKPPVQAARSIRILEHAEASQVAAKELEQMLFLLESLSEEDWKLPTVCTLWNVSDMVAHLAGTAAGYTSWSEFKRQFITNPYSKDATAKVHAISQCQVEDRRTASPPELLAELRDLGPKAIHTRHRLPWLLRAVRAPFGPPLGIAPVGYLTDLIYTRDMWMHRIDICRATGKEMKLTPGHDGRIVELVMRDLGRKLHKDLGNRKITVYLTGPAGGTFCFGTGLDVSVSIEMDALEFNMLAAGRTSHDGFSSEVPVIGDLDLSRWFLSNVDVPF